MSTPETITVPRELFERMYELLLHPKRIVSASDDCVINLDVRRDVLDQMSSLRKPLVKRDWDEFSNFDLGVWFNYLQSAGWSRIDGVGDGSHIIYWKADPIGDETEGLELRLPTPRLRGEKREEHLQSLRQVVSILKITESLTRYGLLLKLRELAAGAQT